MDASDDRAQGLPLLGPLLHSSSSPLAYVRECFPLCMAIITNICVNRMARQLQDNIWNYAEKGNVATQGTCKVA